MKNRTQFHKPDGFRSRRPRLGLLALGAAVTALSITTGPVTAGAQSPIQVLTSAHVPTTSSSLSLASPYGEVARFGGYDATGSVLGKFVYPVGFAVAPAEENDVYVLDRVVNEEAEGGSKLGYRLQKLSSTGTPLGSVVLPVQTSVQENNADANPMVSLAVDSTAGRVYALVEGMVESGGERVVPVAQRVVAWSTTPSSGKLVKAPGYPEDELTHAALVAGAEALEPAEISKDLYSPQGVTVTANHDVVIEAQQGVNAAVGGPTILQQIITEGAEKGKLGEHWVASAEHEIAPANQQADGLFTANDGSLGIDLYEEWGDISRLADVKTNFEHPEPALIAKDKTAGVNLDEAPTIDGASTVNYHKQFNGQFIRQPYTAASPITQLTNGLYAARYAYHRQAKDSQTAVEPWGPGNVAGKPFWLEGEQSQAFVGEIGIRLFEEDGEVVGTIGGSTTPSCNIDTAALSVAAGSAGSVFVLTQPNEENGNSDDQVIEFAPGGEGKCPQPSGVVTVNEVPIAGGAVTVHQNLPVVFDAFSIERAGETPFEFDWNLEGEGYELSSKMTGPSYLWPSPVVEHTFTTPGVYSASLRLIGDYGTSVFPFTVKVLGTNKPVAAFGVPSSIVEGQPAMFDASGSKPTEGSEISSYHWEFGDGSKAVTQEGHITHTYSSKGTYQVKLIVEDEASKQSSEATMHEVTVSAAAVQGQEGPTTTTPVTTTPIVIPPPIEKIIPKPVVKLTNAQKLAKALRMCKKQPKSRRARCIKLAKKKYAPKKKKRKK
jgi:hypothetical protein